MNGSKLNHDQPSLELWFDAGTLDNNLTSVSLWEDKTTKSGRDAISSNTSNQPTYDMSNSIFVNQPTVRFDGNDNLISLTGSALNIDGNQGQTIFF